MEKLCQNLILAREVEATAKKYRLKLEEEIIKKAEDLPLEGMKKFKTPTVNLLITTRCTRKLDYDAYLKIVFPENLKFVDLKPAINLKKLRAVELVYPKLIAECVTVYPSKPSIKVQEVE